MTLVPPSEIRDVTGITPGDTQAIYHFLQGAMYCWCKNRKDEWFSLRDLMGKENFDITFAITSLTIMSSTSRPRLVK